MTRDEIIARAKHAGYREVKTSAGWTALDAWTPYGIGRDDRTPSVSF